MEVSAGNLRQPAHKSAPTFWLWQLTQAANGEYLRHFKTIKQCSFETKMYFTASRFITVQFYDSEFYQIDYNVRKPYDSLIAFYGQLEKQISAKANNIVFPVLPIVNQKSIYVVLHTFPFGFRSIQNYVLAFFLIFF